jgi:hypothetical protein
MGSLTTFFAMGFTSIGMLTLTMLAVEISVMVDYPIPASTRQRISDTVTCAPTLLIMLSGASAAVCQSGTAILGAAAVPQFYSDLSTVIFLASTSAALVIVVAQTCAHWLTREDVKLGESENSPRLSRVFWAIIAAAAVGLVASISCFLIYWTADSPHFLIGMRKCTRVLGVLVTSGLAALIVSGGLSLLVKLHRSKSQSRTSPYKATTLRKGAYSALPRFKLPPFLLPLSLLVLAAVTVASLLTTPRVEFAAALKTKLTDLGEVFVSTSLLALFLTPRLLRRWHKLPIRKTIAFSLGLCALTGLIAVSAALWKIPPGQWLVAMAAKFEQLLKRIGLILLVGPSSLIVSRWLGARFRRLLRLLDDNADQTEATWQKQLYSALDKQRALTPRNTSDTSAIRIHVVKASDFENWRERFQRITKTDPKQARMEPKGALVVDVEELTNAGEIPNQRVFLVSPDLSKVELAAFLTHELLEIEVLSFDMRSRVEFPAAYIPPEGEDKSLAALGIQSGDLAVLYVEGAGGYPAMISSVSDSLADRVITRRSLDDFFATAMTRENMPQDWCSLNRDAWDFSAGKTGPKPLCIGAVLLYTEEDRDIAVYVRQYYAVIHTMSGCYLTFYTFEHCPEATPDQQSDLRDFWSRAIAPRILAVWKQFGLTRTKPYPSKEIYAISESLGIQASHLPCVLLFREWSNVNNDRILLPIRGPVHLFFRQLCSDVRLTLDKMRGGNSVLEFLRALDFATFATIYRGTNSGDSSSNPTSIVVPRDKSDYYVMRRLFLSHSHADKGFVERLAGDLCSKGIGVWMDKWEIRVGESLLIKITEGIQEAGYLGVILSKASVRSEWVRKELNTALMRELQERRVVVLPILLEECDVPLLLRDKKYADFTKNYTDGLNALMEVFDEHGPCAK